MSELLIPIANIAYYLTLFLLGSLATYAMLERSLISASLAMYFATVLMLTKAVL